MRLKIICKAGKDLVDSPRESSLMIGSLNQINDEVPYNFWVYVLLATGSVIGMFDSEQWDKDERGSIGSSTFPELIWNIFEGHTTRSWRNYRYIFQTSEDSGEFAK